MAAMAAMGMAGCENASTTNSSPVESVTEVSEKKSEVIAVVNSEPSAGCNPITGYGQRYDPILQSTLTKAYGGEITNDLATGYEVSDDGKEWTFTIRDDALFKR